MEYLSSGLNCVGQKGILPSPGPSPGWGGHLRGLLRNLSFLGAQFENTGLVHPINCNPERQNPDQQPTQTISSPRCPNHGSLPLASQPLLVLSQALAPPLPPGTRPLVVKFLFRSSLAFSPELVTQQQSQGEAGGPGLLSCSADGLPSLCQGQQCLRESGTR